MAPARPVVFLHVGAMKTGTTFLQQLMSANKRELAEAGYLFPGERWLQQAQAARDIMDRAKDPGLKESVSGKWARLASQMLEYDGHASIFSMEFLSLANDQGARRVTESLAGATVHVVLTVRDAIGTIPGQWQTYVRNGGTKSWPAYAAAVASSDREATKPVIAKKLLRAQGIPRMLDVWGKVVPAERIHVVTVPRPGSPPDLLWERFASVVGVDPETCQVPRPKTNASLGHASADLMRRVNRHLGQVPLSDYRQTMKMHLAQVVLSRQATDEERPTNSRAVDKFAVDLNRRTRSAIQSSGVHLVGDLRDLPLKADGTHPKKITAPSEGELLTAAAGAMDGMNGLIKARARMLRSVGVDVEHEVTPEGLGTDGPTTPARWAGAQEPVTVAATEIATQARVAIDLRRRFIDHQAAARSS